MVNRRKGSSQRILIPSKKKIAFVCSGGGAKAGAFHLGVALALQEQGFNFYGGPLATDTKPPPRRPMDISTYVGSSAGSIVATLLAAGFSLDNIFNSLTAQLRKGPPLPRDVFPRELPRLTYQKMFKLRPALAKEQIQQLVLVRRIISGLLNGDFESLMQFQWLKTTGLFSAGGIEQYLREEVLSSNRFQDYVADLFIVATQLNHSRKVVFGKYSFQPPPHDLTCQYDNDVGISDACAASASLPPLFAPYTIRNKNGHVIYYIDGEIRDTLSTHVAVDSGADLVIASYTHQPYHFVRETGSLTEHGLPAILVQSIYLLVEQKINNFIYSRNIQREAIQAVARYCKDSGVSEDHRRKILEILEQELHQRMDVDTIYIHPSPTDSQSFFREHFSLSPDKMADTVRSGFRAAIEILKRYEFADRRTDPAIGDAQKSAAGV